MLSLLVLLVGCAPDYTVNPNGGDADGDGSDAGDPGDMGGTDDGTDDGDDWVDDGSYDGANLLIISPESGDFLPLGEDHVFEAVITGTDGSILDFTEISWTSDVQDAITTNTFPDYAQNHEIDHYRVDLEQGDLYFFNTRLIHEVPPVEGDAPRIVLATFIGYSPDDPEVYVWS